MGGVTLYAKLFVSHALVVALAVVALLALTEGLASGFIRHHVEQMVALIGPAGRSLSPDLERGMRGTLTSALLLAVPLALAVAAVAALLASRRVVGAVRLLSEGSRALAGGEYRRRLPEEGRDELADLARHFNRMAGTLQQVEQARTELIGNVAHELRTPLAAARGYAEGISDGVLAPPGASQALLHELGAMERLVRDLSLVSRIEAGAVELHLQDLAVQDLLDRAAERFGPAYAERGVDLQLAPAGGLRTHADPERAEQVLANLLSNALRHTPNGGQVQVGVSRDGPHIRLRVQDSGPGVAPQHAGRVFERFYRADPARSRASGGSGVGLTIARGLARAMHGELGLDPPRASAGASFSLTLPAGRP